MADSARRGQPEVPDIASAAVDHVRLGYYYLDIGDIDGYGSLFDEQVVLRYPGVGPVRGRDEVERFEQRRRAAGPVRHTVTDIVSSGRLVVAFGRVDRRPVDPTSDAVTSVDFVDVFTVSDDGLISKRRRYLDTAEESA